LEKTLSFKLTNFSNTPTKKRNIDDRNDENITKVKRPKFNDKSSPKSESIRNSNPSQSFSESISLSSYITPFKNSQVPESTKSQLPLVLKKTNLSQPKITHLNSSPQTQYESLSQYPTQPESLSQYPITQAFSSINDKKLTNERDSPSMTSESSPCSQEKYNYYLNTQKEENQKNSYLAPLPLSQPKTQLTSKSITEYSSKLNEEFLEALQNLSSSQELSQPTSTQKLIHIFKSTPLRTQPSPDN